MYGKCDLDVWGNECSNCQINQSDLLFIIFHYWLHKPLSITMVREMMNLYRIINTALQIDNVDGEILVTSSIFYLFQFYFTIN